MYQENDKLPITLAITPRKRNRRSRTLRLDQRRQNRLVDSPLVNISATSSTMLIEWIRNCREVTHSQKNWKSISICFARVKCLGSHSSKSGNIVAPENWRNRGEESYLTKKGMYLCQLNNGISQILVLIFSTQLCESMVLLGTPGN